MTDLIEIEHLYKKYDEKIVLEDINLKIPSGSIFGLLGPNGAGKTTLIRLLNNITIPDQGNIKINTPDNISFTTDSIGYLPEERGLYKQMKVAEHIIYLARLKGMSKENAYAELNYWFDKMDIHSWKNKKIEELSKGMQQKIQFIGTIIHKPSLIILDEPFSGFDPINANVIKNEILELKEKGHCIILSTHNMNSVEELCENIALINKGKIIQQGNVQDIRRQYSEKNFEFKFIGNMASFSNALWSAGEVVAFTETKEYILANVRLNDRFPIKEVLKNLLEHTDIKGFSEILPSMNDIFIKLVTQETTNDKQ